MIVELVGVLHIDRIWPLVSKDFVECLNDNYGDCSAGDLWTQCRSGNAFLIVAHENEAIKSASVWRFENWLKGPVFRCLILTGKDMKDWFDDVRTFCEQIAKDNGATFVWDGRDGWGRAFPEAKKIRQTYMMEPR